MRNRHAAENLWARRENEIEQNAIWIMHVEGSIYKNASWHFKWCDLHFTRICLHACVAAGNFLQKDANFCLPNRKLPLCVRFPRASALKSHLTLSLLCGRVFVCWQSGAISSAASSSRPQFTETRREEAMIHTVLSVNRLFYGCITQARAHYRDTHSNFYPLSRYSPLMRSEKNPVVTPRYSK
jgi:hypothetical protein